MKQATIWNNYFSVAKEGDSPELEEQFLDSVIATKELKNDTQTIIGYMLNDDSFLVFYHGDTWDRMAFDDAYWGIKAFYLTAKKHGLSFSEEDKHAFEMIKNTEEFN